MTDEPLLGPRHTLYPSLRYSDTVKWLRNYGYEGTFIPPPPTSGALDMLLFGRPGEFPRIAVAGCTLVWGGSDVTVSKADPSGDPREQP